MNGKAMGKCQSRAFFQIVAEIRRIQIGLQFVRRQDHRDIGPGCCSRRRHHFEAGILSLGNARRSLTQTDNDFLYAGIIQVVCMGVPLAAIANDRNLLVLDKIDIRIPVVINSHRFTFPYKPDCLICSGALSKARICPAQ